MPVRGWLVCVLVLCACVTTRGADDSRLDEDQKKEEAIKSSGRACGPDGPGDVVLLDARTGGSVPCLAVTVSWEPASCAPGTDCPSEVVFKGLTNKLGQVKLAGPVDHARLTAVADGFDPSTLSNATSSGDHLLELELAPDEGYWLKALDGEGNYLQDLTLTFKQGDDVLAQLRTNTLANVFFNQRQPFAGQAVTVEAEGYRPATVSGPEDLGEDGHTLTLSR